MSHFGTTQDGQSIELLELRNSSSMIVKLCPLGATITEIHVPDRDGSMADVVLGFDSVEGYQSESNQHFGCLTGRFANRIAKGTFTLNGQTYQLAINNGPNHLHGGVKRSLDKLVWDAKPFSKDGVSGVEFHCTSPDGEEGFPGNVDFTVTYTLTAQNELKIDYLATSDAATPLNLTNHSYFNLAGAGAETALDHELQLMADQYTVGDDELIPTGEIASVEGTPLDFRQATVIGARIEQLDDAPPHGYDQNFVLNSQDGSLTVAAIVKHPGSGRVMTVSTTEPGIQLYTANWLFGQTGKGGKRYLKRSAICLEAQHYPDSVNRPEFPSVILEPGKSYTQTTVYAFSVES